MVNIYWSITDRVYRYRYQDTKHFANIASISHRNRKTDIEASLVRGLDYWVGKSGDLVRRLGNKASSKY